MANLNLSEFGEKLFVADADHTFIWDSAASISKRVSRNSWLSAGSIATSTPLTISQTWTDAAVAFAAMKIVATDTNSAANSDFLELYSGTATQPLRLDIQKTGQLNIYGTWSNSTSYERLSFSAPTAANAIIGTNKGSGGGTARGLDLHTDGAARMTITTAGNVGIGTTAPGAKLDISTSASNDGIRITNTNAATSSRIAVVNSTAQFANFDVWGSGASFGLANAGVFAAQNNLILMADGNVTGGGTSSIQFRVGGYPADQERMRISASGNVGIGTTSPTSKLHVAGTIKPEQATMVDKAAGFTLAAVDAGTVINSTSATAITINLPAADTAAGYNVMIIQSGAGAVTINANGNTLNSFGNALITAGQHAACSIVRTAASTYNLSGNLV